MKKLLTLLMALLMVLSLTSAAAESAMQTTISLTLDSETMGSMIQQPKAEGRRGRKCPH